MCCDVLLCVRSVNRYRWVINRCFTLFRRKRYTNKVEPLCVQLKIEWMKIEFKKIQTIQKEMSRGSQDSCVCEESCKKIATVWPLQK